MRPFLLMPFLVVGLVCRAQSPAIHLNQLGFYPNGPKIAIVTGDKGTEFFLTKVNSAHHVYSGKLSAPGEYTYAPGKKVRVANFSEFRQEGEFLVHVPGVGVSAIVNIRTKVHHDLTKATIKSFYYQRFSIDLPRTYAGKWSRKSNIETEALIHPSAATGERPAGTRIKSGKGWIDAGDYNKYVVNSGITTSTLLAAYEDFSPYFDTLRLNIPESANALPDVLDEVLWNIRWMLTMQGPTDGGVYHKCSNPNFDGMVMPDQARQERYLVQKSTAATLDLAAVMAHAYRVFKKFPSQTPGLADSCLTAAQKAWAWASRNPMALYEQDKLNRNYDPDITTGAYGDSRLVDELAWAAAEIAVATGDAGILRFVPTDIYATFPIPSWDEVGMLGTLTLLRNGQQLPTLLPLLPQLKQHANERLAVLFAQLESNAYRTLMGSTEKDFVWGSNSVAANQAMTYFRLGQVIGLPPEKLLDVTSSNLDYLMGRNATGYSFVTGFGVKTPMHIHHRPSEADGILEPVPGLLAGGPNPGRQDNCSYPSLLPNECYVDDVCSYASNEVAINWNAPLVYLAASVEVMASIKSK